MSNIQAQIDALTSSISILDNTILTITGNTLSNYNQLSRIVAQQGNIYNTIYYGTGNLTTGNLYVSSTINSNSGFIPLCRASISFQYTTSLNTFYSNNCYVSRNDIGSYTITFINPPNHTNYTACIWASSSAGTSITQPFIGNASIGTIGYKTGTQALIWISNNNSDVAIEPSNMCECHFYW